MFIRILDVSLVDFNEIMSWSIKLPCFFLWHFKFFNSGNLFWANSLSTIFWCTSSMERRVKWRTNCLALQLTNRDRLGSNLGDVIWFLNIYVGININIISILFRIPHFTWTWASIGNLYLIIFELYFGCWVIFTGFLSLWLHHEIYTTIR